MCLFPSPLPGLTLPLLWAWEEHRPWEGEWSAIQCCIHCSPSAGPSPDVSAAQTFCSCGAGAHLSRDPAATGKGVRLRDSRPLSSWSKGPSTPLTHACFHSAATLIYQKNQSCWAVPIREHSSLTWWTSASGSLHLVCHFVEFWELEFNTSEQLGRIIIKATSPLTSVKIEVDQLALGQISGSLGSFF